MSHSGPAWIATPAGRCFTWYHPPNPGSPRACAVLLCDPFGWHRMVLHATYRQLALRLANDGFAVLRLDYPATCDSEGQPRDLARVNAWLDALAQGADHLLAWSGASRLTLFGALLGGTLATMLAARRTDVEGLALWGPYLQGRVMVRTELAAAALRDAEARVAPGFVEGDREAFGFLLGAPFVEELRAIDLANFRPAAVRHSLVLSRAAGSGERKVAEHLCAAGADVAFPPTPAEDLDAILHGNGEHLPSATLDSIAAWISSRFPEPRTVAPGRSSGAEPELLLATEGVTIRERTEFIGRNLIFGILTEPAGRMRLPAVVMVNGGRNHRVGINRNYTEWARRLAARGHAVLRIDLRGLGDTDPATPEGLGRIYTNDGTQDVLDAVAWLRAQGHERICCVGLCAGGTQAFRAALLGPTLDAIVMLNPLKFHADMAGAPRTGLHGFWRRAWQRLPRELRTWGSPERRIAASFTDLSSRGVDALIVYNSNEAYREFLEGALHRSRRALGAAGRFRIEIVGASDHIYSPLWAQAEVGRVLEEYVERLAVR